MYRQPARHILSPSATAHLAPPLPRPAARRFLSTAPPHARSRSWKNSFARWGLAAGLVYYYNTSPVFAEEPSYDVRAPLQVVRDDEHVTYPTLEELAAARRAQRDERAAVAVAAEKAAARDLQSPDAGAAAGSPDELEEEAEQQGAFNEETGEINWECPCLGGMAHGPCGEQFREAFSCFVFSKEEPKGVDCIDRFKNMQDCFRANPEVYGAELEDEEPELVGEGGAGDVPAGAEVGVGAARAVEPSTEASKGEAKAVAAAPETAS